jgi:ATP-dependent RNA helicase DDX35
VPIISCNGDTVKLRRCIIQGFFSQGTGYTLSICWITKEFACDWTAAKLQPDGSYRTIRENYTVHIHPSSVLFNRSPKWVIYNEGMIFNVGLLR